MSDAATAAITDTLALGKRLVQLTKEEDAWDLPRDDAVELLRAVELIAGSLSTALGVVYVERETAAGRTQRAFSEADEVARHLRAAASAANRARLHS